MQKNEKDFKYPKIFILVAPQAIGQTFFVAFNFFSFRWKLGTTGLKLFKNFFKNLNDAAIA